MSSLRQRHHVVRCVDVLIYYSIVVSTFLLYSVGFIAYKLDEDPEEVKEFYRTMTTSASHTVFTLEGTRHLHDRADEAATERSNDVASDDTRSQELLTSTDTVPDANEVEQRQRYTAVPPRTPKVGSTSRTPSPHSQASPGDSLPYIYESQNKPDDSFVHLLQVVAASENRKRASRDGATPARGVGANTTTVPFLTFPGLSQW
ncbi:uncharacterized protein [Dermacentor andersoni]|uniref:uncharacterized protein n=1 Tax=Dermacentor andersoni TaxID=34620 RepID=UPI002415A859|nr:uncharacterized protein LOC129386135 [Dermacentor andersoni]